MIRIRAKACARHLYVHICMWFRLSWQVVISCPHIHKPYSAYPLTLNGRSVNQKTLDPNPNRCLLSLPGGRPPGTAAAFRGWSDGAVVGTWRERRTASPLPRQRGPRVLGCPTALHPPTCASQPRSAADKPAKAAALLARLGKSST